MKNPPWHRDEIILALNLYLDPNRGSIDAKNPKVIEVSILLNKLPIHSNKSEHQNFRNPNGVSLKLSNFLSIDPTYKGKGMSAYSKLDEEVFNEFFNDQTKLNAIASEIRDIVNNPTLLNALYQIEETENESEIVKEGQVLLKVHKYRERNNKIVAKKKGQALKKLGRLTCEVCDFDFFKIYGEMGYGFIECHHIKPLSTAHISETKIEDLALVCSNCHRMLHRSNNHISIAELRNKIHH